MKLRNWQSSPSNQAQPTLKSNLEKFNYPFSKPFLLCVSQVLSMAIVLAASPGQAEEQVSVHSIHSVQSLKQAAMLSAGDSIEGIETASPLNRIAQVDTPTPPPSEPFSEPTSTDRWQFSVEPYVFVPLDVKADVTVAGRSASIQAGLGEILSLDRAFDAGLRLEARKNRLGFILDGFYVAAKQSGNLGVTFPQGSLQGFGINTAVRTSADASASVRQGTIDLAAFYRVVDTTLGNSAAASNPYPRLAVEPIVGLRIDILRQKLEVDTVRIGNLSFPVNQDFSLSRTTASPLIGARIGLDLSERWTIGMRGDVSGFDLNSDRDFTWNLLIGTQYHLSPRTSLQLSYRFNGLDFEDGSGLRRAKVNLRQNGLSLSVIFRF